VSECEQVSDDWNGRERFGDCDKEVCKQSPYRTEILLLFLPESTLETFL